MRTEHLKGVEKADFGRGVVSRRHQRPLARLEERTHIVTCAQDSVARLKPDPDRKRPLWQLMRRTLVPFAGM